MFTKSQKLVTYFAAWVIIVLTLLTIFQSLSYEYFFVLCLIGFLIIVELTGPFTVRPRWRTHVNVVIVIGVLIFAVIVANKVLDILGVSMFG